jgi:hypothetical protein
VSEGKLVVLPDMLWLAATNDALLIGKNPVGDRPPLRSLSLGSDAQGELAADIAILREQGIAVDHEVGWQVAWCDWPLALDLGAKSLLAYSTPCHFLLEIDRKGEVGRPDFRYILRWREGARDVEVERYGAYVRHSATDRVMHLDSRLLEIVQAVDHFNALSPERRQDPGTAWGTLAGITDNARALGARLDRHLSGNVVIVPPTIGLIIRGDGEGNVSFLPKLVGDGIGEAFSVEFQRALEINDVMSVTLPDRRTARVLLSEPQREVLRRMRQVRRVPMQQVEELLEDPSPVFDGVIDAIDLADVSREYPLRVIGIGKLILPTDVRHEGGPSVIDRLQLPAIASEGSTAAAAGGASEESGGAATRRSAVSIDLLEAETGQIRTVRLSGDDAVRELRSRVKESLDAGNESFVHEGVAIRVEPELIAALDRHVSGPNPGKTDDLGSVGRSGHLYLLINEHEDTLTPGLEVLPLPEADAQEAPLHIPAALHESIKLKSHQLDGVRWLATCRGMNGRRGALLADDMGLGKTLQVLVHVAGLIESGALGDGPAAARNGPWRPVLIVAPLLLVESGVWTEEMRARFADAGRIFEPFVVLRDEGIRKVTHNAGGRDFLGKPILDPAKLMAHKVVITTYETMMSYQHSLAQLVGGRPIWSLVVFDEAQEVKSPKTKQSIAAKALDAQFKLAATGTPVETRLRDLWNLLDTVEPGRLGTQKEFVTSYERPAMNSGSQADREAALHSLRAAIRYERPGALLIRRDKSILPDLPERIEHRVACTMTSLEEETMGRIRSALGSQAGRRQPLAALQQLHLCTQHPVLAGAPLAQHGVDALIATSARLAALVKVLRDIKARDEKVLIFARSVEAQRLLARVISKSLGIPVDIINGQTGVTGSRAASGTVRREILSRFRAAPGFGAIVLSPFVAGVGLTLTEANHVIHYGRWWNPAIENQATDRAHRIGQTKPVHVYYLIGVHGEPGQPSFDEVLDTLLRERRDLARDFLSPAPEEATADLLVHRLGSQDRPMPTRREPTTVAEVAAVLLSEARTRGESAGWLGEEGMYGVHVLTRGAAGLRAIRIVDRASDVEQRILLSGQKAWQDALGLGSVEGLLVARVATAGTPAGTWREVAQAAAQRGESGADEAYLLMPLRRVDSVRAALFGDGVQPTSVARNP